MLSRGLVALGGESVNVALQSIAELAEFNDCNDPYGEHDFGSVEVQGERLIWKIDYYDHTLLAAADPSDASCVRVMTVMLAHEY